MVEIAFLMDKSGSMEGLRDDAIGGFNGFLKDQRAMDGRVNFTLALFDTNYSTPYAGVDIKFVPGLDRKTYAPAGGTALLDALGRTINEMKSRIALGLGPRPEKVIVAVMTDGQENSSRQFTRAQIKEMTQECQRFGWEFIYLGANQDSFAEAATLGIPTWAAATTTATADGFEAAFKTASVYTNALRGGATGASMSTQGGVAKLYDDEMKKKEGAK